MSSEDKLFDMLRRVPFEDAIQILLKNLNEWNREGREAFIHSQGWTIDEFNQRWLRDLAP